MTNTAQLGYRAPAGLDEIAYRFTRRSYGGWNVVRADNGRSLGWLCRTTDEFGDQCWSVHVSSSAFRGTGPNDTGDLLDSIPGDLHRGDNSCQSRSIALVRTRDEGAQELVWYLNREMAPAVGHGPHYRVRRWVDR